jgi:alpha-glucosidase
MLDAMRFWLDRGVDGYRVDVMWLMIKDEQIRDNPPNPNYSPDMRPNNSLLPVYSADRPEIHEIVAMMRRLLDQYDERMIVGEIYLPVERLVTYYGVNGSGAHLPFNFQLIELPWNAHVIGAAIDAYEAALPPDGWPNWVLGNHDQHRIASRVGARQARVAAMLLLTLRGTPTMYYGDEIGMHDVAIPPELVQDPQELGMPGFDLGRDPERTPMQWDASANAGFSAGTPWLPIAEDYQSVNVAAERADPTSTLTLYHRLIGLRRATLALEVGSYAPVPASGDLIAYLRSGGGGRLLIVLNLGQQEQSFEMGSAGRVVLSTWLDRDGEPVDGPLTVRADEGVIVELAQL